MPRSMTPMPLKPSTAQSSTTASTRWKGWTTCFSVASTDSAVAAAQKAGAKITMAPQDTEFGRFAVLEDPWGLHSL
ncbi:MAG: VOC family protein [Geodermatophilaceae bacterium]